MVLVYMNGMSGPFDPTTAYHEAGHAVMALVLGRPVHAVSVMPDERRAGACEFGKPTFRPTEDWLEREILISLAGLAAEAKFTGDYNWGAAARDQIYVQKLAESRAGEKRAERLQRRLLAKAEHLLNQEEHWQAVEWIAAELIRLGSISGRAAKHFFERALAQSN